MQLNVDIFWNVSFLIVSILCIITLLILLISGNFKKKEIIYFSFLTASVSIWSVSRLIFGYSVQKNIALIFVKFSYLGGILIPFFFLKFLYSFFNKKFNKIFSFIFNTFVVFLTGLSFTDYFISGLKQKAYLKYYDVPGPFYVLYIIYFNLVLIYCFYLIYKKYTESVGLEKNQVAYLFLGTFLGYIGSSTTFPLVYNIPIFPFGIILVPLYPILIAYAIIKYRLMDIKVAIARGIIFGFVFLLVLSVPFTISFYGKYLLIKFLGDNWWIFPITLTALISSLGPTIYSKIKEKAEWTLFTKQKEYQDTLTEMGEKMTLTKDLNDLLTWITRAITVNVGISYTRIFLWDEDEEEYTLRKEYGVERRRQFDVVLNNENPVIEYLNKYKDPALRDEIINYYEAMDKNKADLAGKTLRNTGAALIV
ncbi:MAG: histidine kinase N-terminal 7TM domain-containing protein, partial [Atribacterota bacterium]